MPNRAIKESCRTSRTLEKLSDGAEVLHWRLVTVADDFGRFDANPSILKSLCFPLRDKLKVATVADWFEEMVMVGLVKTYQDGVRVLGYYPSWAKHQRIRCGFSKFPDPPNQARPDTTFYQRAIPKELREAVLERDGRKCLACGADNFLVMDHIVAVINGGEATLENLQTLCDDCNSSKYTQTLNFLEMSDDARRFAAIRRELRQNASDPDLRSTNNDQRSTNISAADAAASPPCSDCLKVLSRLNQCQGRNGNGLWRVGKNGTYPGLHDRHKETSVEACLQVVNVAGKRLWDDPKTRPFSRPSTLFGPRNFTEKYLPEAYAATEEENAH